MNCRLCNRPGGPFCTGCRTVSRVKWLWETRIGLSENPEALGVLRNCAGALTDLAELFAASGAPAPEERERTGGPPPGKEEKDKAREDEVGGLAVPKVAVKTEDPSDPEEEESEEEGSEECGPPPKAEGVKDTPCPSKGEGIKSAELEETAEPLGLQVLPQRLSAPDPQERDGVASKKVINQERGDRKAEGARGPQKEKKRRPEGGAPSSGHRDGGHARPKSPEYPPGGWDPKGRDRSRSRRRQRTSKGKKKRERGRDFYQQEHIAHREAQWRRR